MDERNAMMLTLGIWNSDQAYRDHVRAIWPDLGRALDRLNTLSAHTVTTGNAPAVPSLAPPVPRSAPRSHSAARWDRHGDDPTSAHPAPVQMPLPLDLKDEK
jgi:hypothetical protein